MVFAYIDPGTGSLLGSAVVGLSLTLIFYLRGLFYRIFTSLTSRRNSCGSDFSGKLVFFSEGRNYWHVFQPIFEELGNVPTKLPDIAYLTADKEDPGLQWLANYPANIQIVYLGKLNSALYTMNRLKAAMCVMTTPQLDIIQLRRSPHVQHYCHVMHSPTDVHTYEKFAFDHFDSVLCASRYVVENLKFLEQKRQTDYMRHKGLVRERFLLETGCPYYQYYFQTSELTSSISHHSVFDLNIDPPPPPCVVLASSWGERSFLGQAELIIESLLALSYKVIFRPHPQAWVSNQEDLRRVEERYGEHIEIDREVDNREALSKASLLICDISGIIYDFVFMYRKPVLGLFQEEEVPGYEKSDIEARDSAFDLLQDVGASLPVHEIAKLSNLLPQLLATEIEQEVISKYIFHLEDAGRVAAEQILNLYPVR